MKYWSRAQSAVVAGCIYFVFSVLLTWPLLFKLNVTLFGDFGDTRGQVWKTWAQVHGFLSDAVCRLVAAPFGEPTDLGFSEPFSDGIQYVLARMTNEIVAHNLVVLIAFPLTGVATFILIDSLFKNKVAAFFGGLQFGFAPVALAQAAGGHTAFATNFFIPLFLLALVYNRRALSIASSLLVGVAFSFVFYISAYMAYFAVYFWMGAVIYGMLKGRTDLGRQVRHLGIAGLTSALLILPFIYQRIFGHISPLVAGPASEYVRPFLDLQLHSARLWEYFVPSVDHPFLGHFYYDFVRANIHGSNIPEQTLYLGFVPIGLAGLGCFWAWKKTLPERNARLFIFSMFALVFSILFSLPPIFQVRDVTVPNMSYFAYNMLPMFRAYSRIGVFANLFLSICASAAVAEISVRLPTKKCLILCSTLCALLIFEYWGIPEREASPIDHVPGYVSWLQKQDGDFIIAEYPMMRGDEISAYTYLFWQRIHQKRMINGAVPFFEKPWSLFLKVKDLAQPSVLEELRSSGVRFVILHEKMYREGPVPKPIQRYFPKDFEGVDYGPIPELGPGAKLAFVSGTDLVFDLQHP